MTIKQDFLANKQCNVQLFLLSMHKAAILDFEPDVTKVSLSFQVRVPTSGGLPDDVSDWKLKKF